MQCDTQRISSTFKVGTPGPKALRLWPECCFMTRYTCPKFHRNRWEKTEKAAGGTGGSRGTWSNFALPRYLTEIKSVHSGPKREPPLNRFPGDAALRRRAQTTVVSIKSRRELLGIRQKPELVLAWPHRPWVSRRSPTCESVQKRWQYYP